MNPPPTDTAKSAPDAAPESRSCGTSSSPVASPHSSSDLLKALGRQVRLTIVGIIARELSMLPVTRSGRRALKSWFSTSFFTLASRATMAAGLLITRLLPERSREEQPAAAPPEPAPPAPALEAPATPEPAPQEPAPALPQPAPTAPSAATPRTRSAADRRIALLKRCGLFSDDQRGARITRAATLEDLRNAYKLVHTVYLGTGYIPPEVGSIRLRIFETSSETATFVAKIDGRVVGVISVIRDSEFGLPSDASFRPELDDLRAKGKKLCEVTNQVVDPEFRESGLPTALIRCAVAHGIEGGFDEGIAAVSPNHNSFYEMLGFRQVGTVRSYSIKVHDPVVLLSMDVDYFRRPLPVGADPAAEFVHRFLSGENHFRVYVGPWEKRAERSFMSADLLESLFISERNFIEECTPEELEILHRRWGSELFNMVSGGLFLPSQPSPRVVPAPTPESAPTVVGIPMECDTPIPSSPAEPNEESPPAETVDPRSKPLPLRKRVRQRSGKRRREYSTSNRPTRESPEATWVSLS